MPVLGGGLLQLSSAVSARTPVAQSVNKDTTLA
jgi:hypothetical protein